MEYADRIRNLNTLIAEQRLIRNNWEYTDDDGRQYACLLAALSPEAAKGKSASECPASVMPGWLAYLTPVIDDEGSFEEWPNVVRRYANLAQRWHALTEEQWNRAALRIQGELIKIVHPMVSDEVSGVGSEFLQLVNRVLEGNPQTTSPEVWEPLHKTVLKRIKTLKQMWITVSNELQDLRKQARMERLAGNQGTAHSMITLRQQQLLSVEMDTEFLRAIQFLTDRTPSTRWFEPRQSSPQDFKILKACRALSGAVLLSQQQKGPNNRGELAWDRIIDCILNGLETTIKSAESK